MSVVLLQKYHKYTTYKVIESTNIKGGASSKYIPFGDYVIKYSYDGISYIKDKETVWEEAYEMKQPIIDVCDDYVAIADKNTNDIFIYNDKGRQGQVSVSYPIVKLEVAKQELLLRCLRTKHLTILRCTIKRENSWYLTSLLSTKMDIRIISQCQMTGKERQFRTLP